MLNGGAHYSLEIEAELRIRPLPYFQRREQAEEYHNGPSSFRLCWHVPTGRGTVPPAGGAAPTLAGTAQPRHDSALFAFREGSRIVRRSFHVLA